MPWSATFKFLHLLQHGFSCLCFWKQLTVVFICKEMELQYMIEYGSNLYFIDQYNFYMTVLKVIHFIFQIWILFSLIYNSISFVGKSHYIRIYIFKLILTICEYDNVLLYSQEYPRALRFYVSASDVLGHCTWIDNLSL